VILLVVIVLLLPRGARGAFESLPGPIRGGIADWMGRGVWPNAAPGIEASFSLSRPADVTELAGTHAALGWRGRRFGATAEGYRLGLGGIYDESIAGLWLGWRGVSAGLRRWQVRWAGLEGEGGWSVSLHVGARWGKVGLDGGIQDHALGRRSLAGPERRVGARGRWAVHRDVELEGSLFAAREGGSAVACRWSPVREIALLQELRFPDQGLMSGIEVAANRWLCLFWFTPDSIVGSRIGASCRVAFRGPRQR
jgi:hypothetical protein